jgi:type I restriction enzyme, S subunit
MCSLEEQEVIVRKIESAFIRVSLAGSETKRNLVLLDRLEEKLLAKAFSGKLTL